jgi:hypothetical protein
MDFVFPTVDLSGLGPFPSTLLNLKQSPFFVLNFNTIPQPKHLSKPPLTI